MGLVYTNVELSNVADESLCEEGYLPVEKVRTASVQIMADSGAIQLAINERTRHLLGLKIRSSFAAILADGTRKLFDIAGPIKVKFRERYCITQAVVLPGEEEMLLGAIPMEQMDLVIIPSSQTLEYNPAHPKGWTVSMRAFNQFESPVYSLRQKTQPVY